MDVLSRLLALEHLGIKVGLENIRALTTALGHPERAYRTVHVAGTNGKGSVSAMVDTGLRAAGHRTALYTSPHLVHLEERFLVQGRPVERAELSAAASEVLDAAERLTAESGGELQPTFFEVTTALAFEVFRRQRVDVAVLEVGMGGRFDATNLVSPAACAITSVALDHERFLGTTLEAIAFEKAGIIKAGVPVVLGALAPEALRVVLGEAGRLGAPVVIADPSGATDVTDVTNEGGDTWVTIHSRRDPGVRVKLALRGRHQVANAVVAMRLLDVLDSAGIAVPASAVRAALTDTSWRGRLDWIDFGARRLLLDAAHNPAGARTLAAYLGEAAVSPLPLVFGAMADKDTDGMLRELLPHVSRLILTRASHGRAAEPAGLAAAARALAPMLPIDVTSGVDGALDLVRSLDADACVAGSIFVLGEVLARLDPMRSRG